MVHEVLLEHEAPLLDGEEQGTLHGTTVDPHPSQEDVDRLQTLNLFIDFLKAAEEHQQLPPRKQDNHMLLFSVLTGPPAP